jgi:hypothetical protein
MTLLEQAEAAATDPFLVAMRKELDDLDRAHKRAEHGVYKDALWRAMILTQVKYEGALRELVKGSLV